MVDLIGHKGGTIYFAKESWSTSYWLVDVSVKYGRRFLRMPVTVWVRVKREPLMHASSWRKETRVHGNVAGVCKHVKMAERLRDSCRLRALA